MIRVTLANSITLSETSFPKRFEEILLNLMVFPVLNIVSLHSWLNMFSGDTKPNQNDIDGAHLLTEKSKMKTVPEIRKDMVCIDSFLTGLYGGWTRSKPLRSDEFINGRP